VIVIRNVLVATDFGDASEAALNYGRDIARQFYAKLHLLHVTQNMYYSAASGYGYSLMPVGAQETIEAASRHQTEALLTQDDWATLRATAVTMTHPSPAVAIVEYAKSENIDLIVVGTHGRGPVAHMVMGSVAERVVRTAPSPVLAVRHPQHEVVVPDAVAAVSRA
jgi:nucleotide-binding universal stress UspA family protein